MITKQFLKERIDLGRSAQDIAKEANCSVRDIISECKKHGLRLKSIIISRSNLENEEP